MTNFDLANTRLHFKLNIILSDGDEALAPMVLSQSPTDIF